MKTAGFMPLVTAGALVLLAGCFDFDEDQKVWCKSHPEACAPLIEEKPAKAVYVEKKKPLNLRVLAKDPAGDALRFSWSSNVGTFGAPSDTGTTTDITWTAPDCVPPPAASLTLTVSSTREASASATFSAFGMPECPTLTATGPLATARTGHTATLLYSSDVLVVGGEAAGTPLSRAELYTPRSQAWAPAIELLPARTGHGAVRLDSGLVLVTGGRGSSGALKNADLFNPDERTWTPVTSLTTGRHGHAAVLLHSGKVFVTGGTDGKDIVATTELFTQGAQPEWTVASTAPVARDHPVATVVGSGKVLVSGGMTVDRSYPGNADVYDPDTGTWTQVDAGGEGRIGHTATLLPSGQVLVTGGANAQRALDSSVVIDVENRRVAQSGRLATARSGHTATLLPSGVVLVTGGRDTDKKALASAEVFDPETGTWSPTLPLAKARHGHSAVLLGAGKVLLVGGEGEGGALVSAELYDPGTKTWTSTDRLLTERVDHTATLLESGQVLVLGGSNLSASGSDVFLAAAERYDPATGKWTHTASMQAARKRHTATLLPSGRVLVVGGHNGTRDVTEVELFDPVAGTWSSGGKLLAGRFFHSATLLKSGKVLVAGGDGEGGPLTSAELYDPASGTWERTGPMGAGRVSHTATLLPSGKVLVTGGYSVASGTGLVLQSAELYDPQTGTWASTGSMAITRGNHTATLLPTGKVLVVAGHSTTGQVASVRSAELYDPATGKWAATGSLTENRRGHSTTLLASGKVLVTGGFGGFEDRFYLSPSEVFDPATERWSLTSGLLTPRQLATATLLPLGKVLVTGGRGYENVQGEAELYMP
ncbi:kelch domain-containing protein [Myxococcus stipitatus DSM 14675]|uniref:Kelch domain-containing protein n=1 Tax=Myxococcus stipitatus (strain DSM 14675 / JCM 12634 / Mx s8) TaxID=1278073 RepID=L7UBE2_MYXSD|nr:kelch repeat-containing protein [Myxococcus stipitatus]AGC43789.1 kelch domain-containing protein [Myxococcus stipitatus DSM 14675]